MILPIMDTLFDDKNSYVFQPVYDFPGRDEHPLPADGPDKIIGNFSGIDLFEIFHNLFVPFCDSNLLQK